MAAAAARAVVAEGERGNSGVLTSAPVSPLPLFLVPSGVVTTVAASLAAASVVTAPPMSDSNTPGGSGGCTSAPLVLAAAVAVAAAEGVEVKPCASFSPARGGGGGEAVSGDPTDN